jgi:hypothetical protein
VRAAIAAAVEAPHNRGLPTHARVTAMLRAARIVEERADEPPAPSRESKTIREARKEVMRAVNTLTLSAEEGDGSWRVNCLRHHAGPNRWGTYYRFIASSPPFNDPLNLVAHRSGRRWSPGTASVKPATASLSALLLGKALLGDSPRRCRASPGAGDRRAAGRGRPGWDGLVHRRPRAAPGGQQQVSRRSAWNSATLPVIAADCDARRRWS